MSDTHNAIFALAMKRLHEEQPERKGFEISEVVEYIEKHEELKNDVESMLDFKRFLIKQQIRQHMDDINRLLEVL